MIRLTTAATALAVVAALAAPAMGANGAAGQITICHATSSAKNPFVVIHPASAGVAMGHVGHQGDRDVIPPFTYRGTSYSQNWDAAGQAIHANGCVAPVTPPGGGGGGGGVF